MENHPVNTPVGITISASDPAEGHSVTYFAETSDAESAFVLINQISGVVTLAQAVDYDPPLNHRQFSFRVRHHYLTNALQ